MTKHPLTDEMIEDIAYKTIQSDETIRTEGLGVPPYRDGRVVLRYDDMRKAYDLGREKGREDRLKQVIEWLEDYEQVCGGFIRIAYFKQAMRPQQEDNND